MTPAAGRVTASGVVCSLPHRRRGATGRTTGGSAGGKFRRRGRPDWPDQSSPQKGKTPRIDRFVLDHRPADGAPTVAVQAARLRPLSDSGFCRFTMVNSGGVARMKKRMKHRQHHRDVDHHGERKGAPAFHGPPNLRRFPRWSCPRTSPRRPPWGFRRLPFRRQDPMQRHSR